jgi:HTH-type transcriptional repressor of NAD biosynthesis genes
MSKRFQRGLVVGKFAPLHRGHELIIRRAFDECDEVVILSYCKPEFSGCNAERRQSWLSQLFPTARILVLTDASLAQIDDSLECGDLLPLSKAESHSRKAATSRRTPKRWLREVPANDESGTTHSRFCGLLCTNILGVTVDAVFTSEDYGEAFAEELTRCFREHDTDAPEVQHVLVDRYRKVVPVSGTLLRKDLHANREWLSPEVYLSFVQRVCLLGGESSGKSTLAERLASEFGTVYVCEYGRDLWEAKNGVLEFDDMIRIARRQVAMEDEAAGCAQRFLFCDTSPLTTLFYSRHLFGRAESELEELANRFYETVVLCVPDFPFMQDGTRQPESFRTHQHEWYLQELAVRGISFLLAAGSVADRVHAVRQALTAY